MDMEGQTKIYEPASKPERKASRVRRLSNLGDRQTCMLCRNNFEIPPRALKRQDDMEYSHVPKVLDCLHSFCQTCLEDLVVKSERKDCITCPDKDCLLETPIGPELRITGLPNDYTVIHSLRLAKQLAKDRWCDECAEEAAAAAHCASCGLGLCAFHRENHARSRATAAHQVLSLEDFGRSRHLRRAVAPVGRHCHLHPGEAAKLFCWDCAAPVCHDCSMGAHQDHAYDLVEQAAPPCLRELAGGLRAASDRISQLDYAVKSINIRQQAIGEKVEALSTDIAVYFDELRQSIDRREESLLQKLKEIKVQKVTTLEEQRQTIREHTEELKRAHQFVDSVCYPQKHSNTEILDLYFTMKQRLQDLLEQCKDVQLNPLEEVDIVFDGDERLGKALQSKFEILGAVRAGQVFEEEAKVTNGAAPRPPPAAVTEPTPDAGAGGEAIAAEDPLSLPSGPSPRISFTVKTRTKDRVPGLIRARQHKEAHIVVECWQGSAVENIYQDASQVSLANVCVGKVIVVVALDVSKQLGEVLKFDQSFDSVQDPDNTQVPMLQITKLIRSER